MSEPTLNHILNLLEALLLSQQQAFSVEKISQFLNTNLEQSIEINRQNIEQWIDLLAQRYDGGSLEIVEISNGWRLQLRNDYSNVIYNWVREKPPKYSRALFETLVLIAYKQPITRGEIENIRGVAVSSQIIKTLQEREWIRIIGHKEVPGRPALYATTKQFLEHFSLKQLSDLPPLEAYTE